MANNIRLLSGRIKSKAPNNLDDRRDEFISLDNAEPNLGTPSADDQILGSLSAANGGTRKWITTSGDGIKIGTDGSGNTQLEVDETTLPIEPAGLFFATATNLKDVLDQLDSAMQDISTTATQGATVTGDSNLPGAGTVSDPLRLDSSLRIISIDSAQTIVADTIGDSSTIVRGDGSNLTNLPIDSGDITTIARNALTGGVGIAYDSATGNIAVDSSDPNVKLNALEVSNNLTVHGNLTVDGTQTIINTTNLNINDPKIQLAVGNESNDAVDIGFIGHYFDSLLGGKVHTGFFRDASPGDKGYYLFNEYIESSFDTGTPASTIDRSKPSFKLANFNAATVFATKGDFDSAVIDGDLNITSNGNIVAASSQLTISTVDAGYVNADSADITLLSVGTIDSAIRINADSGDFTSISFDSIDSDTRVMLQLELVPKDAEGNIDSDQLPDLFLRNDGNDSTTGAITADGGFIGNLTGNVSGDVSINSALNVPDNANINVGNSNDLQIYHNGSNSFIKELGTGSLFIDGTIFIRAGSGNKYFSGQSNIAKLYHTNNEKLATTSTGISVTGQVVADSATFTNATTNVLNADSNIFLPDNAKINVGDDNDLQIIHNGTNTQINNYAGALQIIQREDDNDVIIYSDDGIGGITEYVRADGSTGEAILSHYGTNKLATKTTGISVTGKVTANQLALDSNIVITNSGVSEIALMEDASSGAHVAYDGSTNLFEIRTGTDGVGGHKKRLTVQRDEGRVDFYDSTGTSVKMRWDAQTNRLGINETSPQAELDVAGNVYVDSDVSANTFTRRSSTATAGSYGSATAIPIVTVDSNGFIDSVSTASVAGVDSISYNDTTGVLTVFTGAGTQLTDSITLNPFTTADLTEDSTALYYTDSRADSAARSAVIVTNVVAGGFGFGGAPGTPSSYGLYYDSATGTFTFNGLDSADILSVVGGSTGTGSGGGTGSQTSLVLNGIEVDSALIYENLEVQGGGTVTFRQIDSVDSAFINRLDVTTLSFDSIPDDGTSIIPLYALPDSIVSAGADGLLADSVIPQNYIRNDGDDSTTGKVTADGGFAGNLTADSANITTLTGTTATFDSFFGSISGTNIDSGTVANDKLTNSSFTIEDSAGNSQVVSLGQGITFSEGSDIDITVGGTRKVTITNPSTLHSVTSRGDSTTNAVTFGNITTTGYIAGPASFTIDPAGVGDNTGTVVIAGNLQVDGTTTTINSTAVTVNDKSLTLADSAPNSAAADSAGLIIDGSGATWLYRDNDSSWTSNIKIVAPEFSGSLDASNITGTLPDSVLPSGLQLGGDGTIDSAVVPDLYLRNDGDDSTTGSITADGGFIGSLTGNATTATTANTAARWTNARTVTFTGGATGNFNIRGDSDVSVALTLSGTAVNALFVGGTGVTIADDSISIGQDVATTADVTFASVTADSVVNIGETTTRDKLTIGGASTNDIFGITFVDPTTATNGGHISYRDSNNTITLGTVTSSSKSLAVTVATSGVGIFNTTPGKELDVTGEIRASSTITSNSGFSGDGSALTNLNATQLTSGTVPTARISGNYANITGVGTLNSGEITSGFGDINIGTNSVTAQSFSGSGANLTSLNAGELASGTVPEGRLSGAYTGITSVGALDGGSVDSTFGNVNIGTSVFTGDGSGLFNVDAATLGGVDPEEFSRTVVLTDSDNGSGPSGTGYYYRIANFAFQNDSADATFLYSIMPEETTAAHSGATILSVQVKKGATTHTANVDILAMGGTVPFSDNAFRIVNTASASSPQLWMQSNIAGVRLKVVEMSAHNEGVTVTYNDKNALGTWQSGTPSSNGTAVISNGLTYRGFEVFHQGASVDSATLNNPTITGSVTLGQEVTFDDGSSVTGDTKLRHGSQVRTSSSPFTLDEQTASSVTSGKYIITAQRASDNHITEVNFITTANGSSVAATEFGTVYTTSELFTVDMDVSGGQARLRITPSSSTTTKFKFSGTLFYDA